ncbi:zincin-like metallopeptidase domain-containing protein [Blautia sp.]|uniref:DNA primase TraC n=1 Tax=Blautia glucerasea TaxID=536633 RepID=A0A6N2SEM4_9FIRM
MPKVNIYDIFQAKLMERLQQSIDSGEPFQWVKPWKYGVNYSCSYFTPKKPFAFLNQMLLEPGEYLTFSRIQELHREKPEIKIKKGARQCQVFQYYPVFRKEKDGSLTLDKDGNPVIQHFSFRYTNEYHISDLEGLESHFKYEAYEHQISEDTKLADEVIEAYCREHQVQICVREGSSRAFYRKGDHSISLPEKNQFPNIAEYYSTVFHELGHSTMKENSREDLSYAQEELVAEITASTLCGMFHLENRESGENHVAYLRSWLKHVKEENPKALVSACYAAQKASDLVLGNRKIFLEERNRAGLEDGWEKEVEKQADFHKQANIKTEQQKKRQHSRKGR